MSKFKISIVVLRIRLLLRQLMHIGSGRIVGCCCCLLSMLGGRLLRKSPLNHMMVARTMALGMRQRMMVAGSSVVGSFVAVGTMGTIILLLFVSCCFEVFIFSLVVFCLDCLSNLKSLTALKCNSPLGATFAQWQPELEAAMGRSRVVCGSGS